MKSSLLITAIILVIGGYFGWQRGEKVKSLETTVSELVIEVERHGGSVDETMRTMVRPERRDLRAEQEAMVKEFLSEMIEVMRKMEEKQKSGEVTEGESMKEGLKFMDKFMLLTNAELKMMVEELKARKDLKDNERQGMMMFAIMMLSQKDPEGALTLIMAGKDIMAGGMGGMMLASPLSALAKQDPAAAVAWMKENKEVFKEGDMMNDHSLNQVISQLAQEDMLMAVQALYDLGRKLDHNSLRGLAPGLRTTDDALAFLVEMRRRNPEFGDELKSGVFNVLASGAFMKDIDSAQKWLGSDKLDAKDREAILESLNYYESRESTREWLDYLVESSEDTERNAASRLISGWTRSDFRAAGEWLNQQAAGEAKNHMVSQYAQTLSRHEPEAAAVWAETLPEGESRKDLHKQIYQRWKKKDTEAAAAFAKKWRIQED